MSVSVQPVGLYCKYLRLAAPLECVSLTERHIAHELSIYLAAGSIAKTALLFSNTIDLFESIMYNGKN